VAGTYECAVGARAPRFREALEVPPDALLLGAAEGPLHDPALPRGGRVELLAQPVVRHAAQKRRL